MDANEYRDRLLAVLAIIDQAKDPDDAEDLYNQIDTPLARYDETIPLNNPAAVAALIKRFGALCGRELTQVQMAAVDLMIRLLDVSTQATGRPRSEILQELAMSAAQHPIDLDGE